MTLTQLCQLAGTWSDRAAVPEWGTMAEEKIDGWRALYLPDHEGRPALWTRNGMPIRGAGHILATLERIERAAGQRLFIDGEWQVDGSLAATKAHAEQGWRGGDAGIFHAFDCVALDEWRRGGTDMPLYQRKALLAWAIGAMEADPLSWEWLPGSRGQGHGESCVRLAADRWCADRAELMAYADEVWAAGGEGLMVKDAEAPYRRNRNDAWRKLKHPRYVPGRGIVAAAA